MGRGAPVTAVKCLVSALAMLVACSGGDCKTSGSATGTCAARVADGAACKANETASCQAPAKCVDGRCTIADPSACK